MSGIMHVSEWHDYVSLCWGAPERGPVCPRVAIVCELHWQWWLLPFSVPGLCCCPETSLPEDPGEREVGREREKGEGSRGAAEGNSQGIRPSIRSIPPGLCWGDTPS